MTVIKEATGPESEMDLPRADCVAIDAVCMINRRSKPINAKTGNDLVLSVCSWVDALTQDCSTVTIAFDTYLGLSLKDATRRERYSKGRERYSKEREKGSALQSNYIDKYLSDVNE